MLQDLRIRFGVILALALLPLLVFSAWSSFYDYSQDQKLRDAVIQDAGILAVREIIDSLDTTKSLLLTTAQTVDIKDCESRLELLTMSYHAVNNMAMAGPDGRVICSAFPIASNEPGFEAAQKVSPVSPFFINSYHFDQAEDVGAKDVVLMSFGYFIDGSLEKIVFANANVFKITDINQRDILPSDVKVSVFSGAGNLIIGPTDFDVADKDVWLANVSEAGFYQTEITTAKGAEETLTVLPTREPDIFVAMVAPKQSLWDWNRVDPFVSLIVPFLAWVFGFVAIWIATEILLLRHLRRMEITTQNISNGAHSLRLGNYEAAPKQIRDLAGSFDNMLETLKARDDTLVDSLDEKEKLLREIHHRVKNNLQIIISLLNMQKRGSKNEEFLTAIEKTRNRVSTIALVHKALYKSDDIRRVDMDLFIQQLVTQLTRTLKTKSKNIRVSTFISCSGRDSDQATAVGLYIVEAMTNAVQHNLLEQGDLSVKVFDDEKNTVVQICSNGEISDTNSPATRSSRNLMKGFARQLSGTASTTMDTGMHLAELVFPLIKD